MQMASCLAQTGSPSECVTRLMPALLESERHLAIMPSPPPLPGGLPPRGIERITVVPEGSATPESFHLVTYLVR